MLIDTVLSTDGIQYQKRGNDNDNDNVVQTQSQRMRWAGHVARMGRRGTRIDYWWESQKERDH
jgi:hypothetical protein